MTKAEFVTSLSERLSISKSRADEVFSVVMDSILETLTHESACKLDWLGSLKVVDRAARQGRNPSTGEVMQIPARKTIKFVPSKKMKEMINEQLFRQYQYIFNF